MISLGTSKTLFQNSNVSRINIIIFDTLFLIVRLYVYAIIYFMIYQYIISMPNTWYFNVSSIFRRDNKYLQHFLLRLGSNLIIMQTIVRTVSMIWCPCMRMKEQDKPYSVSLCLTSDHSELSHRRVQTLQVSR